MLRHGKNFHCISMIILIYIRILTCITVLEQLKLSCAKFVYQENYYGYRTGQSKKNSSQKSCY